MRSERLAAIAALAQPRLETLGDWGRLTNFLFVDAPAVEREKLAVKGLEEAQTAEAFQFMLWTLEREETFIADVIQGHFRRLSEALGLSLRDLTRPFYVAMSGETASLPLFQSMEILGPDLVRARVRRAIEALGGISGKRMKKLRKRFESLG